MTILILAEHDGTQLNPSVQQAVSAAQAWNSNIHVLVAGAEAVVKQAASIAGVERVIYANAPHLNHLLAEDVAGLILSISKDYNVILAAHSSFTFAG